MAKGGMNDKAFSRFKNAKSNPQRKEALRLCELAGIDPDQPCGLDEVRKLQDVLPNYRLCVYTDNKAKECVFKGDYAAGRKNVLSFFASATFFCHTLPTPSI